MSPIQCPKCGIRFIDRKIYTLDEAAIMLRRPLSTIQWWAKSGQLPVRVAGGQIRGRLKYLVDANDLDAFIDHHFPHKSELSATSPNPRARLLFKMLTWRRMGAEAARAMHGKKRKDEQRN